METTAQKLLGTDIAARIDTFIESYVPENKALAKIDIGLLCIAAAKQELFKLR